MLCEVEWKSSSRSVHQLTPGQSQHDAKVSLDRVKSLYPPTSLSALIQELAQMFPDALCHPTETFSFSLPFSLTWLPYSSSVSFQPWSPHLVSASWAPRSWQVNFIEWKWICLYVNVSEQVFTRTNNCSNQFTKGKALFLLTALETSVSDLLAFLLLGLG